MSRYAHRLQSAAIKSLQSSSATLYGWDISTNGVDWSKVNFDGTNLTVIATGEIVSTANKSDWGQYNTLTGAVTAYQSSYGNTQHIKWYDSGNGITTAVNSYKNNGGTNFPNPVICYKVWNLADFNSAMTYFGSINKPWIAVYYQEPQSDGKNGIAEAQPAYYCQIYQNMDNARLAHPNGNLVKLLKNLAGYPQLTGPSAGYAWQDYDGGQKFIDYVGSDLYSSSGRSTPYSGSDIAGWLVTWSQTTGVPPACPEFGLDAYVSGNGTVYGNLLSSTARRDAVKNIVDYMTANQFAWVNYWNPNSGASTPSGFAHWELQDASKVYWQGIMAAQ